MRRPNRDASERGRLVLSRRPSRPATKRRRVGAPFHESVALKLDDRLIALTKRGEYHEALVDEVREGSRYLFVVDGRERPDPASRSQPDGVHAASEVIGADFEWHDHDWRGIPLEDH